MNYLTFKGELTLYFDDESVKGEFLDSHDLDENERKDKARIKAALTDEVYSWLECMNIGVKLELKEVDDNEM
jgi:hypothetical protein|tara:strand:+ start:3153 stop:3368 length:216 start_codon:yes stop_codon:yes gene_type:complete